MFRGPWLNVEWKIYGAFETGLRQLLQQIESCHERLVDLTVRSTRLGALGMQSVPRFRTLHGFDKSHDRTIDENRVPSYLVMSPSQHSNPTEWYGLQDMLTTCEKERRYLLNPVFKAPLYLDSVIVTVDTTPSGLRWNLFTLSSTWFLRYID